MVGQAMTGKSACSHPALPAGKIVRRVLDNNRYLIYCWDHCVQYLKVNELLGDNNVKKQKECLL
jgi:hypothetical protein